MCGVQLLLVVDICRRRRVWSSHHCLCSIRGLNVCRFSLDSVIPNETASHTGSFRSTRFGSTHLADILLQKSIVNLALSVYGRLTPGLTVIVVVCVDRHVPRGLASAEQLVIVRIEAKIVLIY